MSDPFDRARYHAREWLDHLGTCPAGAQASAAELRAAFGTPLPETGRDAGAIIDDLGVPFRTTQHSAGRAPADHSSIYSTVRAI